MKTLLNETQQRSLEVALQALEELILRSQALRVAAQDEAENGILVERQVCLSVEQQRQLAELEVTAAEQLRILRDGLQLMRVKLHAQRKLASAFSILWADLKELEPEHWSSAGELSPQAKTLMEPAMAKLIEVVTQFDDTLQVEQRNPKI